MTSLNREVNTVTGETVRVCGAPFVSAGKIYIRVMYVESESRTIMALDEVRLTDWEKEILQRLAYYVKR